MKRYLAPTIKCLLSIAILTYLLGTAIHEDQFEQLFSADKNWFWMGAGLAACLTAHLAGFLRWWVMVRAIELPFRFRDAMRIGFMGVFFNLFAFGLVGGDVVRGFYVARQFKFRKTEAIATVVADRMMGLLTTLTVASLAFQFLDFSELQKLHPDKTRAVRVVCQVVTVATVAGFGLLAGMFFSHWLSKRLWFKKLLRIPTLGVILRNVFGVVSVYRNRPGAVLSAFALSVCVNIFFAVSIYLLAVGMFDDAPSLAEHFVIGPISMVSNAIPLPGGLGGMELALHLMYQAFDCEHGVVVAFAFRFCLLAVAAIGAVVWLFNRKQLSQTIEQK